MSKKCCQYILKEQSWNRTSLDALKLIDESRQSRADFHQIYSQITQARTCPISSDTSDHNQCMSIAGKACGTGTQPDCSDLGSTRGCPLILVLQLGREGRQHDKLFSYLYLETTMLYWYPPIPAHPCGTSRLALVWTSIQVLEYGPLSCTMRLAVLKLWLHAESKPWVNSSATR
jgi:hypothetical protein